MSVKFGRAYRLTVVPLSTGSPIIIELPFTMQLSMVVDSGSYMNQIDIDVLNLSEEHRNQIYQDRYVLGTAPNLILEAGYANLYRIFYGRIFEANSSREGSNIVTRIRGLDSNVDVNNTQVYQTLQSGQTLGSVLQYIIGQFPNLQQGNDLAAFDTPFNRAVSLNGNAWNLLKQYSSGNVFISNGKIYVLRPQDVLNSTTIIDADTGLLETPRRDQGALWITTLFEPSVQVGQQLQFQSKIQPNYNGTYKVLGVAHRGVISGAVCGKLISTFRLLAPNQFGSFNVVNAA